MNKEKEPVNFEHAFKRLEEILEKLHSSTISLDESLKLYEEADGLIVLCNSRLNEAEKKIEILIKNRQGELTLDSNGQPITQKFKDGHD